MPKEFENESFAYACAVGLVTFDSAYLADRDIERNRRRAQRERNARRDAR